MCNSNDILTSMNMLTDMSQFATSRRIEIEAALVAEAIDEIERGLFVESEAVDAWIESIGTADELPPPFPAV